MPEDVSKKQNVRREVSVNVDHGSNTQCRLYRIRFYWWGITKKFAAADPFLTNKFQMYLVAVPVIFCSCSIILKYLRNRFLAVSLKSCLPVTKLQVTPVHVKKFIIYQSLKKRTQLRSISYLATSLRSSSLFCPSSVGDSDDNACWCSVFCTKYWRCLKASSCNKTIVFPFKFTAYTVSLQ